MNGESGGQKAKVLMEFEAWVLLILVTLLN